MTTFQKVKLGEVITKIIGGGTPSKSKPEFWNGDIPWASVKDLSDGKYYLDSTKDSITQVGLENSSSNIIKKGSIILPTRMGLGRVVKTKIDTAINQDLKAIIPNDKIENDFLLLVLIYAEKKLQSLGAGSTVLGIKLEILKDIEIDLPDLKTQSYIASTIIAYNSLIENIEKRIEILEETARKLYTEWFVKFKFPSHEKVCLVESSTEYGMIPKGWKVMKLGEVIELVYGKALKAEERISGNIPVYGSSGLVGMHNQNLILGPGIIIGRKGNVGSIYWVDSDFCAIDTTYYVKTSFSLYFMYYLLKSISENFLNSDVGVPGLSRSQAYTVEVLMPNKLLVNIFANKIAPYFKLINYFNSQVSKLKQTRDILISQLVTGKRKLKD